MCVSYCRHVINDPTSLQERAGSGTLMWVIKMLCLLDELQRFQRRLSIIYLPLVTKPYSLGMSRLAFFGAPPDKLLFTLCGLLVELPLWLEMLLPVSALRETLGSFSESLSTTKVTTWSKKTKSIIQNLKVMNGWVLQSCVYLARFAQAIHSLVVGKTSETGAVHLQEPVTCRGKITGHSKQFLLFLHWWLCSPK